MHTSLKRSGSPRPKKDRVPESADEVMLFTLFDVKGVVHHEYFPPRTAITAAFYKDVLRRLPDSFDSNE